MKDQKPLKVVPAYRGMAAYVRAAKAAPQADWADLWRTHVLDPFWAEWAAGQFNEGRIREDWKAPLTDLDGLQAEVDLLATSGVETLVASSYTELIRCLPSPAPERTACINALDPRNTLALEKMNGVLGACVGDNMLLTINPFGQDWRSWVHYVMAHEYHHSVWGYNYFAVRQNTRMDLLTSLLNEGQADSFACQLYPQLKPSWITALTPEEEAQQWQDIQPFLGGDDPAVYVRVFFGRGEPATPMWTAYTLGYHIVQSYLKRHPERGVLDLMELESEEILQDSGFAPGLVD